ncbi:MAG: LPXTG cell wall anchor domain-containing protein, partial [Vagococcus sp.]
NTSEQESSSSSSSVIITLSNSNKLEQKNVTKLPKTGFLKSMISLSGYGLIFISVALFLFNKKQQNNMKR